MKGNSPHQEIAHHGIVRTKEIVHTVECPRLGTAALKEKVRIKEIARSNTRQRCPGAGTSDARVSSGSTGGPLEGSYAIGHVAIIDIHRINLGETFQGRLRLASRFLGNT